MSLMNQVRAYVSYTFPDLSDDEYGKKVMELYMEQLKLSLKTPPKFDSKGKKGKYSVR